MCNTSKHFRQKVCNEHFWKKVAEQKLNIKSLGKMKKWSDTVLKYTSNDLYDIGKKVKTQILSLDEATAFITKLIKTKKLLWNGKRYDLTED